MMKHFFTITITVVLISCSRWVTIKHTNRSENSVQQIINKSVAEFITEPLYSSDLKSGDRFVYVDFLGLGFDSAQLAFSQASGSQLFSSPNLVDQAFLFFKLTNPLVKPANGFEFDGRVLSDYYISKIKSLPADSLPNHFINNFPPTTLNSATFDSEFYLTVPNPLLIKSDSNWTKVDVEITHLDSLSHSKTKAVVQLPSYYFKGHFIQIRLERPWFNSYYAAMDSDSNQFSFVDNGQYAYIESLIIAKKLSIVNYSQSQATITISKNGKREKDRVLSPSSNIVSEQPFIMGYIYRIL